MEFALLRKIGGMPTVWAGSHGAGSAAGWRARKYLSTGIVMATVSGILIVTAFGLYYFGAEGARAVAGEVHT
jgi:hypothetical protein